MDQLSAYGVVDKPPSNPDKESGNVGTSTENSAVAPDLPQDEQSGRLRPPLLTRRGP